jgi:threonine dehydrogenase-like Zn-dependent dehydrogenase
VIIQGLQRISKASKRISLPSVEATLCYYSQRFERTGSINMRAARFYAAGDIRIDDIPEPTAKDDEVVLDVHWGGICGTDLHEYTLGPLVIPPPDRPHPLTSVTLPLVLCHEFCGRVSHVPPGLKGADGQKLKEGMPVMVDPRLNCQACFSCKAASTNLCSQWGFLGLHGEGGGFAERVAVKGSMCYPLPPHIDLRDAALIEPLAVGRHGLTMSGITEWSHLAVLVIGGGPVGLSTLLNLRAAGAKTVYLSEPTATRQEHCQPFATKVLNPMTEQVSVLCHSFTDGIGVDVVFDCAGIPAGMQDGMAALRPKGTYVNVAGWEKPFVLPMQFFMMKELNLRTTMAYDEKDFGDTVRDFCDGKFKGAEGMVTARILLEDVKECGFEQLVRNKDEHVKILATPRRELLVGG